MFSLNRLFEHVVHLSVELDMEGVACQYATLLIEVAEISPGTGVLLRRNHTSTESLCPFCTDGVGLVVDPALAEGAAGTTPVIGTLSAIRILRTP